jgi:hypothetical protein
MLLASSHTDQNGEIMNDEQYQNPDWDAGSHVHNWRNYISDEVQAMWLTFTPEQRAALGRQAQTQAENEEWD